MIIRLLVIGAAVTLVAAFFGYRRLAVGLMVGLALTATGLWIYEHYQTRAESGLLTSDQVQLDQISLTRADYRPNLLELSGQVTNRAQEIYLDGLSLRLRLEDCQAGGDCRPLTTRQEYVELKLAPGESGRFREKIYLEKDQLPQGEPVLDYEILDLRGHRPLW